MRAGSPLRARVSSSISRSVASGASNYLLSIGEARGAAAAAEPAYVPGQLIVRFEDGDTGASALDPEARAAALEAFALAGLVRAEDAGAESS